MTNPLVILASPAFPNVPDLPGVPPIARTLGSMAISAAGLLDPSLEASVFGGQQSEQWGIIDSNYNYVLSPDSVVRMDVDEAYQVSDYPVEKGTFASYNKVKVPFAGTLTVSKGGSTSERQTFLEAAKALEASLTSYYVQVPEGSYGPLTIDRVSYERRASSGVTLLLVHLHFSEIRITPPVQYGQPGQQQPQSQVPASAKTSNFTSSGLPDPVQTASPTSQAMVNGGSVSPLTMSQAQTAALNAAVPVGSW